MYCTEQTLRHKERNELVRLIPISSNYQFSWDIGKKTHLCREDGTKFYDDINNYTHVEDEFGRPYSNPTQKGQFVDISAKKYLISHDKLMAMREKSLEKWEQKILRRMKTGEGLCDIPKKKVLCPFADGSICTLFENYFLDRRKAIPLYKFYLSRYDKEQIDGERIFRHTDGQIWIYKNDTLSAIELTNLTNLTNL